MHPIWLIALGFLAAFLIYGGAQAWYHEDRHFAVLLAIVGTTLLTAVALDAVGVIA